nr:retrovirus-related Pol polyprotein from transposon TNT 1-94 [Tanacetum cinerariifolium]
MIATLGKPDLPVLIPETFHEQTDEELTENDIKRIDANDQAIKTILLGLPEDVYVVVDSYETAKEIWECVRRMMKANIKFLNNLQPEWKRHVTIARQTKNLHEADFTQIYDFLKMKEDENFMQPPMNSLEDINDPTESMNTALILFAKAFQLTTPTNNNQRTLSNLRNCQIAQSGMNMSQDRQSQNIGGNGGNHFGQYDGQVAQNQQGYNARKNGGIQVAHNALQNLSVQNGGNQNGLVVVPGIANQNGTGNIVAARAEGTRNGNQVRCYNCIGLGHIVGDCTARPRRKDVAYLQTQLLIAQKKEAEIQLQAEEFDFMAVVGDLDEIKEVNANCILMENLQHVSTSGTQLDKDPVYDTDGSAENDNYVTSVAPSMVQSGGTVETSSAPNEETQKLEHCITKKEKEYDVLWNNWYTKCEECKYDKISYDKAYNDMQQKIERLQAQLGDLKGLVHTARTRRPQHKGNTRNARVPSASKSSKAKKNVTVEDHRTILSLSKNQKTMSSERNNIKLAIQNDKFKIVCGFRTQSIFGWSICDADLEVAFRRNTCFIRDLDGVDLLKGNHSINLYTINLYDMASTLPICLKAQATPTKSWLWHPRLSHLNFDTINDLAKNDLVSGLPMFKYAKEHLCPSYDYYRYTWVHFLRTKDETPEVTKIFLKNIFVRLQAPVIIVRTDNEIEFKNHALKEYFDSVGITDEASAAKTPQQNGVVERRNRTLVEAARTMLIFSPDPLFLWAEAIATACYTQNHSLIYRCFNKTPCELIQGREPDISYLHVFGALCYPKNDREDIGKLGAKGDIGFLIGYSANYFAYRVYNRWTKKIMKTMNVTFDELSAMDFEQNSSKLGLQSLTSGQISSGLKLTYAPSTKNHSDAPVIQNLQAPTASMSIQDSQRNLTSLPTASAADNVPNTMFEGDLFVNLFVTPSTELDVWELVPSPDDIKPFTLKWLFKNKHDEENTVIRNKTRLVVRGYRQEEGIDFKELEDSPEVSMVDNRTMAQLLQAPTVGYEDAIVIPEITATKFEMKHGMINLVQNKQFFGHDKEDPHAHIHYFNKITSTMRVPNVPNSTIKLMLFSFSLEGAARIWLEKEPPRSILTWDDLVSKFKNQFFPPSKTTNLRNEITRFQQRFDESFSKAWDGFNDLLRACPHRGFSELHQLDTLYNALNVNDQDSWNSASGGNFLDKMPCDCLKIIESKSKVRKSRAKAIVTKVNSSSSTPAISSDVAELKDM